MALVSVRLWLFGLFLVAKLLAVLSLAFTTSASRLRDLASTIIICLYVLFYRDTQLLGNETLKIGLNTFSIIQVGNIVRVLSTDRLGLSQLPSKADSQLNGNGTSSVSLIDRYTWWQKLIWASSTVFNFRMSATLQQAKGVPSFKSGVPGYIPTRSAFLARRCASLAVRIVLLRAWGNDWPLIHLPGDFAHPKQYLFSRLRDVTSNELLVRTWATALFWTRGYLNHSVSYDIIAVVLVALTISEPKSWPPMYGSLRDSYTVRGWWGATWHQLLRKQLTSFSNLILHGIMNLRKGTLLARYGAVFLTFWISGLYHILSDGIEVESGVVRFFLMQAAAITVEDGVQALFLRSGFSMEASTQRLVGRVWVVAFLVWTSPGWRYPVVAHRFQSKVV